LFLKAKFTTTEMRDILIANLHKHISDYKIRISEK